MQSIHIYPNIPPDPEHLNTIDRFLDSRLPVPLLTKLITLNEIQIVIKKKT